MCACACVRIVYIYVCMCTSVHACASLWHRRTGYYLNLHVNRADFSSLLAYMPNFVPPTI